VLNQTRAHPSPSQSTIHLHQSIPTPLNHRAIPNNITATTMKPHRQPNHHHLQVNQLQSSPQYSCTHSAISPLHFSVSTSFPSLQTIIISQLITIFSPSSIINQTQFCNSQPQSSTNYPNSIVPASLINYIQASQKLLSSSLPCSSLAQPTLPSHRSLAFKAAPVRRCNPAAPPRAQVLTTSPSLAAPLMLSAVDASFLPVLCPEKPSHSLPRLQRR
jgi:hypothetical protein